MPSEEKAKVSIIVPIFNMEKYLETCLESLMAQTLTSIEIICVNDGSTDSSPRILKNYCMRDPRIKAINKPNSGYGATMNRGIREASGDYIGIVEPDDFVDLDMFAYLYQLASKHSCDIAKSNRYDYRNNEDTFVEVLHGLQYDLVFRPLCDQDIFFRPPSTTTAIYRRSFLIENKLTYLETPGASFQDTGFAVKALVCAERVILTKQPFYHYRRDNEHSSVLSQNKVFCISEEFKSIERFVDESPSIKRKLFPIYGALKYRSYRWNLNRIDWLYRYAFMLQMSKEFCKMNAQGELSDEHFTSAEWDWVVSLMDDPEKLFENEKFACSYLQTIQHQKEKIDRLQTRVEDLLQSNSYRIGRAITYLPRKVKKHFRGR